jgi:hypothetical protein
MDENDTRTIISQLYKLNCQLFMGYPDLDASFSQIILTHDQGIEPISKSIALLLSKDYFSRSIAEVCNLKLKILYLEIGKLLFRKQLSLCQPYYALFSYFLTSGMELNELDILSRVFFAYEKYKSSTQTQIFQQTLMKWSEDLLVHLRQDKLQLDLSHTKKTLDLHKKISSLLERLFVVSGPETTEESVRVLENYLSSITFYALKNFELSELYY